jgi:transposase
MKCPQWLHQRGSGAHSAVRRVRERHIQHKGGTDMNNVHYVGMDVDKEKIVLARLGAGRTAEVQEYVIANTPSAVKKYFTSLLADAEVHASYEAGCFGFGLYRQLSAMGVSVLVAAPGLIPRKASEHIKTDRRDARTLAMTLRAGQLTGIYIPTAQDESVRDYLRMYEDLRGDLRICKQRVLHFLLRRGIRYDQGGPWTVKHKNWLSSLEFSDPRDRKTLDMYLSTMQEIEGRCAEAAEEVEQIASQDRYREQTKKLTAFKGIKTLIALSFVAEIGDFRRFPNARQFMAYLGLVPSEHSSGNKRRQGGITKAGNSHLRRLLVEAAWHYRSYHPSSRVLTERRRGVDPQVLTYANRAGRRLSRKYMHLLLRGKRSQVAVTAVSRELAGFLWGAMTGQVA